VAKKAWAGELIRTRLWDVNDLMARGTLGKLEGGVEYGVFAGQAGMQTSKLIGI
jgi:hypothetical protein